jgi:hypothetical protein
MPVVSPYLGDGSRFEASAGYIVRPCLKKTRAGGLGCSSVVQRLPSMPEALGLIPAPEKKKDKKKKTSPQKDKSWECSSVAVCLPSSYKA